MNSTAGALFGAARCSRAVCIVCVLLMLVGCIDIDITIRIKGNEQVRIDLTYTVDDSFAALGAYDTARVRSLPLERVDFETMVADQPGVHLQRYRQKKRDTHRIITARLYFNSYSAFNSFFARAKQYRTAAYATPKIISGHDGTRLVFPVASPSPFVTEESVDSAQYSAFVHQLYQDLFGKNMLRIEVIAPQQITRMSDGEMRAQHAIQQYVLSDIMSTVRDIEWYVEW